MLGVIVIFFTFLLLLLLILSLAATIALRVFLRLPFAASVESRTIFWQSSLFLRAKLFSLA